MAPPDDRVPDGLPPDVGAEDRPQALIGWLHRDLPHGIELRLQSTSSASALENDEVDTVRLVLTRNQALLLASFLLKVTGQSAHDVPEGRRSWWLRWFSRR